ncbi:MAG: glycoside hydrolase family 88 protein [Planctomycetaceae bacterium]|nr:glycoside hydrolase family 88 protein [Planctomycetaceae bacterium]
MIDIDHDLTPSDLLHAIKRMWEVSARCIESIESSWDPAEGSPVFTIEGRYTAQGWTEWTQGFQFGAALLQFDATGDERFLELGRGNTLARMAPHLTHIGVHDHGFNNISTYGNLRRLMLEGRIPHDANELGLYELALKVSGAVQASRWTTIADGGGFIHSFNGPHSLFCDTIRSLRSLAVAHRLGHRLMGENDQAISLLERFLQHAEATATYNVYYGDGRDAYDIAGRVAHESVFNTNDGQYRCPSTQQGYSPFSTWTRGLGWIMLGYPELLEFLTTLSDDELEDFGGRDAIGESMLRAAVASCDFYIENTPTDGIPYWDTGAPRLVLLGEYTDRPADPFNEHEPVDSSAAAIACQGLLRLGRHLEQHGDSKNGTYYFQAGLTVLRTLLDEPYLNTSPDHQGLLLHAVYHRPRGWDHVPSGRDIPCGESCLWGDYHLLEAALTVQRLANEQPYYTFFGPSHD